MKRIVLALAVAGFATAAMATPAKKKCLAVCPPAEEMQQIEQIDPTWPEELEPMWMEEADADPFPTAED